MSESIHRFSLSNEDFARTRIEAIKETIDELKEEYPEILSLELFGSLTKGNTREDSDIDGYLYIDADLVLEKFPEHQNDIVQYKQTVTAVDGMKTKNFFVYPHFIDEVDKRYEEILRQKIKNKLLDLTDEQVKHMRIMPMSEKILDTLIDQWLESLKEFSIYQNRVEGLFSQQTEIEDMREFAKTVTPQPTYFMYPSILLYSMFYLDVGGDIKKYRSYLLNKLAQNGKLGEYIWSQIIKTTEKREQKIEEKDFPSNKHYPRTLTEALIVYGNQRNTNNTALE